MADRVFNAGEALGYFLTWTTYGTWLPGDQRGWNRKGVADVQQPNPLSVESARAKMKETAFQPSEQHRGIVGSTIRKHCEIPNWRLHAMHARSNHVHVVVTAAGYKPRTVRDQFKSWCTRKLKEADESRTRFWTEGASCRWLNTDEDLQAAVTYVLDTQDRKGSESE